MVTWTIRLPKSAKFNFDRFKKHVALAMRMMDDIIDLELEKVELILKKIAQDPEDEDIRRVEKNLWEKIRAKAQEGRRTGLGITAEGDMLAALGLQYGSKLRSILQFRFRKHWLSKHIALRFSWLVNGGHSRFMMLNAKRITR